jgi:hypothetical protein
MAGMRKFLVFVGQRLERQQFPTRATKFLHRATLGSAKRDFFRLADGQRQFMKGAGTARPRFLSAEAPHEPGTSRPRPGNCPS